MDIRPAVVEDAAAVAAVHVSSWRAAYQGLVPQPYLDGLDPDQRRRDWERILSATPQPRSGTWVADTAAGVTGFVSCSPSRDTDQDPRTVGEVTALYVAPDAWDTGTGRRLLAAAVRSLAGAGFAAATLWVLDTNVRARRFYTAASWRPDGTSQQDTSRGFPLAEVRYVRSPLPDPARSGHAADVSGSAG